MPEEQEQMQQGDIPGGFKMVDPEEAVRMIAELADLDRGPVAENVTVTIDRDEWAATSYLAALGATVLMGRDDLGTGASVMTQAMRAAYEGDLDKAIKIIRDGAEEVVSDGKDRAARLVNVFAGGMPVVAAGAAILRGTYGDHTGGAA